jgi:hypothetical protein
MFLNKAKLISSSLVNLAIGCVVDCCYVLSCFVLLSQFLWKSQSCWRFLDLMMRRTIQGVVADSRRDKDMKQNRLPGSIIFLDSTSPIACITWIRWRRKWRSELIILQHKFSNIMNIDIFISKRVFEMHEDELKIHRTLVRNFWNVQWCISSPGWNLCIRAYAGTTKYSKMRLIAFAMVIEFHQIIARFIPSLIWGQLLLTSPQD